ncbi:MAG: putative intracellular septation protein A [marine bacterium B5-7]|nr:MAG: putative intracellular septation protein A [marine bacterium B5-7]
MATAAAIVASVLQLAFVWWRKRRVEKMLLFTTLIIVVLGSLTLIFHNESFIKWKPTVINWLFALVFFASQWVGKKNLSERMLSQNIHLPAAIWKKLNNSWSAFFFLTGAANLYVAFHYSTEIWVNFKLFGILGLTLIFVILQALYLSKHMKESS